MCYYNYDILEQQNDQQRDHYPFIALEIIYRGDERLRLATFMKANRSRFSGSGSIFDWLWLRCADVATCLSLRFKILLRCALILALRTELLRSFVVEVLVESSSEPLLAPLRAWLLVLRLRLRTVVGGSPSQFESIFVRLMSYLIHPVIDLRHNSLRFSDAITEQLNWTIGIRNSISALFRVRMISAILEEITQKIT